MTGWRDSGGSREIAKRALLGAVWLAPLLLAAGLELARAPAGEGECASPEAPELLEIEVPEQPAETGPGCPPPPTATMSPAPPKAETLEAARS